MARFLTLGTSRARLAPAAAIDASAVLPQSQPRAEIATRRPGRRVLLLTSTLGGGHLRAARAVELALQERHPEARIVTIDFWSLMDARVAWAVRSAYLRLVQEHPELFDRIYRLDQRTWRAILQRSEPPPAAFGEVIALLPDVRTAHAALPGKQHPTDRLMLPLLRTALSHRGAGRLVRLAAVQTAWHRLSRRLADAVREFDPHVVIATQMNSAALLSSANRRAGRHIPTIGVPTDFGVHDFWMQAGIDHYCVAHEAVEGIDALRDEGHRVDVTGIPLSPAFRAPPEPMQARRSLGLPPQVPVVLVAGGSLGLGVDAVAEALAACAMPLRLLVITGRNPRVRARVQAIAARHPGVLQVCDWTHRIEVYMRAADVVVGKPGGLTVAEVLACGRPLLAARALRGQEGFNVRFLEREGVGRLVDAKALAGATQALLADPERLRRMQARAWGLGRRDAAERVADVACRLAWEREPLPVRH